MLLEADKEPDYPQKRKNFHSYIQILKIVRHNKKRIDKKVNKLLSKHIE